MPEAPNLTITRPLLTARLTLRPYQPDDLAFLHDMFGREDVCRYLPWPPMNLDQAKAKLEQRMQQRSITAEGHPIVLAAIETATGKQAGEFMLRLNSLPNLLGEIGWSIHPDAQGRGLATEGGLEMLRLGFEDLGLHRIMAGSDPRNAASVRVMEHLGLRREAVFLESELIKGEWLDEAVSAILASEWRERRRH
jgi:RimJ/RimL family protein N-acetyltransferase